MEKTPEHDYIKQCASEMLERLDHTPVDKVRPANDFIPCLEFVNGFSNRPHVPPTGVYVALDGVMWLKKRGAKKWINLGPVEC